MPILIYFAYAAIGKLLIWAVATAGPFQPVWSLLERRWPKFKEMHDCGWCIGFWVYTPLAYILQVDILEGLLDKPTSLTYSLIGCILTISLILAIIFTILILLTKEAISSLDTENMTKQYTTEGIERSDRPSILMIK